MDARPTSLAPPQRRRSSLCPEDSVKYYGVYQQSSTASASTLLPYATYGSSERFPSHTSLRASYPMALSTPSHNQMEDPRAPRRPDSLASSRSSASFESRRGSTSTMNTISTAPTNRISSDSTSSPKRPVSLWSRSGTLEKQRPAYYSPKSASKPGDGWRKLPEEVLVLILSMLRETHLQPGSNSCATCYMRDMTNLALSCKKWMNVSQPFLYDRIYFNGPHISLQHKKNKPKHNTRLKLLRRTLRASTHLAKCVTELKPPKFFAVKGTVEEQEHYFDTIASLVMACPNLQRLVDFYPMYNNDFTRLFQALFTRRKLTSHAWIIGPTFLQQQYNHQNRRSSVVSDITPPPTPPLQHSLLFNDFMVSHSNWENMTTLLLHSTTSHTTIKPSIIASYLPSLENLHISSFPASSFSTEDLINLRPLKSLTLSSLPGITSHSLSKYSTLQSASSLHTLTLLNLSLDSLAVIARLFSFLPLLRRFTLQQPYAPALTAADSIVLHPYLASRTLTHLHWDILHPEPQYTIPTTQIFAASIATQGFPSLRTIRAPQDIDGHLQQLCRPRDNILLPRDTILNLSASPTDPTPPLRDDFDPRLEATPRTSGDSRPPSRDLSRARLAAQERIERARSVPKFIVLVEDYSGSSKGNLRARFGLGAYMGTVGSGIEYVLTADGKDESNGGLVEIGELRVVQNVEAKSERHEWKEGVDAGRGKEGKERRGCNGSWNREHRKGRKWFGHLEREREAAGLGFEMLFV